MAFRTGSIPVPSLFNLKINMPNYATLTVVGYLTRDPEVRPAGQSEVCDFTVASNYKTQNHEEVFFAECVALG